MAKSPAVLFYTSDFLSGVSDLTMEERGQYITLLCAQHQKGDLSEKTIRLLVGSASKDVLAKFVILENGLYRNSRMHEEIEKRENFTESRKTNGHLGGRPKASGKPSGYPYGKPTDNHMPNLPDNENGNSNEEEIEIEDQEKTQNLKTAFDAARKAFPGERPGIDPAFEHFKKKHKGYKAIIPLLLPAIEREKAHKAALKAAGVFCPEWKNFKTWINNSCWLDEFSEVVPGSSGREQGKIGSRQNQKAKEYDEHLTL